jgi:uncharacterized protein YggT (Ycf19 family)
MARVEKITRTVEDSADTTPNRANTEPDPATLGERIVTFLGGILVTLLAIRVLLSLLGANRGNPFADFIYSVTYPFAAPFFGLFGYEVEYGVSRLEIETIFAIIFYAFLTMILARLFTIGRADDAK